MNPQSFVLSLVLAFTLVQTPDTHSPAAQKPCTPGVSFWKLLDAVRVGYTDGRLGLDRIGGLWELSRYKVVGGYEAVKPLAAGSYLLEFAIDDKPFYRFPFSVVVIKSDDPYAAAGNRYFIEGAWNEYGNIYYQRNDPQSSLTFTTWVQDKVGHQNKTSVPYDVKLIKARDGRVLASYDGTLRA